MNKIIVILIIILSIILPELCYADYSETHARKDPVLAGALSWYVPGLGQLYTGAILKGVAFWIIEETLLISTILTFAELKPSLTGDINLGLNIMSKKNPNKSEQRNALIFGVSLVVIHFVNIIDAVNTTMNYNKKNEKILYPSIEYDDHQNINIQINSNFYLPY